MILELLPQLLLRWDSGGVCSEWHSLVGDRLVSDSLGLPVFRLQDRGGLLLFATRLIKFQYHLISAAHFLSDFDDRERI